MNDTTHVSRYINSRVHEARVDPTVGRALSHSTGHGTDETGRYAEFSYPSRRPRHEPHTVRHYPDAHITTCTCEGYTYNGVCYHATDVHRAVTTPLINTYQRAVIAALCTELDRPNPCDDLTTESQATEIISDLFLTLGDDTVARGRVAESAVRTISTPAPLSPADVYARNTGDDPAHMPCEEPQTYDEWRAGRGR